jgi:hypothetical protein
MHGNNTRPQGLHLRQRLTVADFLIVALWSKLAVPAGTGNVLTVCFIRAPEKHLWADGRSGSHCVRLQHGEVALVHHVIIWPTLSLIRKATVAMADVHLPKQGAHNRVFG